MSLSPRFRIAVVVAALASMSACGPEDAAFDEASLDSQQSELAQTLTSTTLSDRTVRLTWKYTRASAAETNFFVEFRKPGVSTTWTRNGSLLPITATTVVFNAASSTTYEFRIVTLSASGAALGYSNTSTSRTWDRGVTWSGKHIVPVFIAATDSTDAELALHRDTYNTMIKAIRTWYSLKMGTTYGNETFHYEPVKVLRGHYTKAQWNDFGVNGFLYPDGRRTAAGGGCAMYYGAEYELRDAGLLAAANMKPLGTPGLVYYAVNGGGTNGSCGAGAYLAASEVKLFTDMRRDCPTGTYAGKSAAGGTADCRSVGAVAHELGHGMGLPHCQDRATCTGRSIMDYWWEFDLPGGATLSTQDRTDLHASGWLFAP